MIPEPDLGDQMVKIALKLVRDSPKISIYIKVWNGYLIVKKYSKKYYAKGKFIFVRC